MTDFYIIPFTGPERSSVCQDLSGEARQSSENLHLWLLSDLTILMGTVNPRFQNA